MGNKFLWLSTLAVAVSFAGGFLLANALNRNELTSLRSEAERLKADVKTEKSASDESTLTSGEISAKIAEADQNPGNFQFQKHLGLALYQYAAMKKDSDLLRESARILDRAFGLQNNDFDVIVGLGNANFDLGYFGNDNLGFEKSRNYYVRALTIRPNDVEVRTDLGLSYFLQSPPDDQKAIDEFQKSLKANPKHEKTLEFIIQALARQNRVDEAMSYLSKLRSANSQNESLPGLESKIAEAKSGSSK